MGFVHPSSPQTEEEMIDIPESLVSRIRNEWAKRRNARYQAHRAEQAAKMRNLYLGNAFHRVA
jgi:regulator of protease activity HflC (stomatin/prohibitin superfamily)